MRTRNLAAVAGTALAAVLLAACADGPGDPESSPSPPGDTVTAPETPDPSLSPTPPSPPVSPVPPKPEPTGTEAEQTLTGRLVPGVEANCLLLDTGRKEYLLLGEQADELRAGGTVTVRGRLAPDMLSYCQQGTPFMVSEVLD